MDYNPMAPIWLQVVTKIKGDIVRGKISPGEKLPGGRDLAIQYSINPNTAARVYKELEQEGLCETRRGLGTYVTGSAEKIQALKEEMASRACDAYLEFLAGLDMNRQDAIRLISEKEESENAGKP